MMALTALINGIEVGILEGTLDIEKIVMGPHVGSCIVQTASGAAMPLRDQEIIISQGATRKFGGLVQRVERRGTGGEPIAPMDYYVEFIDFSTYTDRRFVVNGGFVAGTELAATALPAIMGYLPGCTLDVTYVNPAITLPHLPHDVRSIRSILDEIGAIVVPGPLAWELNYDKVLIMYPPGTEGAPFMITDDDQYAIGDIWAEPANDENVNRIIGRLGSGTREVIDTFVGDGSSTAFAIGYFPLIGHRGYVVCDSVYETLRVDGVGDPATWDYSTSTGILTRTSAPGSGDVIYFTYSAQFPITVIADAFISPTAEKVLDFPDIFDKTTGQAAVDAALVRALADPLLVHYVTHTDGLEAGMFQTITSSKRGIDVVGYIQEVHMRHLEGLHYVYEVTLLEGLDLQNTWRVIYDEWRETGGGGSSTSPSTVPPPSTGGAPGTPLTSVQFNRSGTFGGDADFTYNEVSNSLCVGALSSITAALTESCFVFGYDCHIEDP